MRAAGCPGKGAGGWEEDGEERREGSREAAAVATRFSGPSPEVGAQRRAAEDPNRDPKPESPPLVCPVRWWLPGPWWLRGFAQTILAGFLLQTPSGPLEMMAQVPL